MQPRDPSAAHRPALRAVRRGAARAASAVLVILAGACATPVDRSPVDVPDRARHGAARAAHSVGLWGDLPYSPAQEAAIPALIADMNAHRLAFSVHNGDLKRGSDSRCDDALYHRFLGWFNRLDGAAMFTPGDNDWTDCDRPSNGGYNALERLDFERRIFFSTPWSMGRRPLRQQVQASPLCLGRSDPTACVENRRWHVGGVTYATLNVQGSCNNLCDTAPDRDEFTARNAANIAWLRDTFADAQTRRSAAVMLISQANPGWDASDPTRAPLRDPRTLRQTDGKPDGFRDYLRELRRLVVAFRRPVAYVHGDSHYHRIDRPFLDEDGHRLENFTRVETFGGGGANGTGEVHWLRVDVDPHSREVFSYQAMIVPANRTAVPAPGDVRLRDPASPPALERGLPAP